MNLRDSNPQSEQSSGCRQTPEDSVTTVLGSSLKISENSAPSPSPPLPSVLPGRRKQNVTPTRSVHLYVTSPSTAILMVLFRLSFDLVKLGYFALGLTVHS